MASSARHILLVPSWYATPSNPVRGSFFREQAHALARAGHRVGVIAPNLRSVRELAAGLAGAARGIVFSEDQGIATYALEGAQLLPGLKPANDRAWVLAGRKLFARYVAEQGVPDVIHSHATFMGGLIGAQLKRESGVAHVITEHSTVYQRRPIPEFQLAEARAALREADARLAVSPQLGEVMESVIGAEARPWEWVPNMVDGAFLSAGLPERRSPGPFRFLNIAFLQEKKGHAELLRAFAQRFSGDASAELRIGGDGPERDRLVRLTSELGIAEQVVWLGALDRGAVLREMMACDAFVLSSLVETFGVVVVEALACGVPVIATRSGGPECIVGPGDGLLVEPADTETLGETMARLRDTIDDYDAAGIRARCAERFSEAALVGKLEAVYARVLAFA